MIDHGFVFNGPHWEFPDSPLQGLYMRTSVYREVRGWAISSRGSSASGIFRSTWSITRLKRIPPAWIEGEAETLERTLEKLMQRRKRVADLITATAAGAAESVSELEGLNRPCANASSSTSNFRRWARTGGPRSWPEFTTFVTMAYIVFVNPVDSARGGDAGHGGDCGDVPVRPRSAVC